MNSNKEYLEVNKMSEETLQIGEGGADIEMHILKNKVGIYFVSFMKFVINSDNVRVPFSDELLPAYPFRTKEAIYEQFGKMMCGKTISI